MIKRLAVPLLLVVGIGMVFGGVYFLRQDVAAPPSTQEAIGPASQPAGEAEIAFNCSDLSGFVREATEMCREESDTKRYSTNDYADDPNFASSGFGMRYFQTIRATASLNTAERELSDAYEKKLATYSGSDQSRFAEAQQAWMQSRTKECSDRRAKAAVNDGTMNLAYYVYLECLAEMDLSRVKYLESL